jgi:hypothetical protein
VAGMTSKERIETAIGLGKPDRVPVVPIIDFLAGRYGGINRHEMFFGIAEADVALERTLRDMGPIDGQHLSCAGRRSPVISARKGWYSWRTSPLQPWVKCCAARCASNSRRNGSLEIRSEVGDPKHKMDRRWTEKRHELVRIMVRRLSVSDRRMR